jgi:hypothetical protein
METDKDVRLIELMRFLGELYTLLPYRHPYDRLLPFGANQHKQRLVGFCCQPCRLNTSGF